MGQTHKFRVYSKDRKYSREVMIDQSDRVRIEKSDWYLRIPDENKPEAAIVQAITKLPGENSNAVTTLGQGVLQTRSGRIRRIKTEGSTMDFTEENLKVYEHKEKPSVKIPTGKKRGRPRKTLKVKTPIAPAKATSLEAKIKALRNFGAKDIVVSINGEVKAHFED
jgi:hypothetical protein